MPDLTLAVPIVKIGRHEILDEVGQGAMGTVYRARDPLIERTVAIKTVPSCRTSHLRLIGIGRADRRDAADRRRNHRH
ncbi:MAG TPA: hypothetical protein VMV78_00695 [Thiobacillus sp.]|nr:hypothetical protein [Thiobacillus sp.]